MSPRALVVDDDNSVVTMMQMIFQTYGYDTAIARSGTEARGILTDRQFDVVITDMRMETSTAGFDVARTARLQANNPAVIILTAYPVLPDAWREAGADAVVHKPADIGGLMKLVQELLAKRAGRPS